MTKQTSRHYEHINWGDIERQAVELLSAYIRVDTSNPPGNEAEASRLLDNTLADVGIPAQIYGPTHQRVNLVARLKGEGSAPPLLLLHHMDVVPANPAEWSVPPFEGEVRDGYVWGRGAIDDKGLGIIQLMAFMLLKRLKIPLKRDVILMAVSDEEEGGTQGARWMIDNHWRDIECEYVWDEGGSGTIGIMGDVPVFAISVSEKRSVVVKLTARGQGGHGSMSTETPLDRLIAALYRIKRYEMPMRFNNVSKKFFRRIAQTQSFPASLLLRNAGSPAVKPFLSGRLAKIPSINATLRDTITATIIRAGHKANVAPELAEATLDVRLLPDTDLEQFLNGLRRIISDDTTAIEVSDSPSSPPPSPMDSAMFKAFERSIKTNVPDAIVTPIQTPVATDSRFFRAKGAKAYGLIPVMLNQQGLNAIHGVDERISVDSLTGGIRIALDAIMELCS